MNKPTCIKCGSELVWGGFAHNQDTCWECFKAEVKTIVVNMDNEEHKDILNWLIALAAETYGYEW